MKSPQSEMIWGAMSSAGVDPLHFPKSTVNAAVIQEILEHFMFSLADKRYDFIFQWDLPTLPKVPKAGSVTMVLLYLIGRRTALT